MTRLMGEMPVCMCGNGCINGVDASAALMLAAETIASKFIIASLEASFCCTTVVDESEGGIHELLLL